MENNVPIQLTAARAENPPPSPADPRLADSAVDRAVDRSIEGRRVTARAEVERLVSAAFRVIERTGNLEPKVSDILAEAGLSNQAFYRHFRGKHELLVAVLDRGIRDLADYLTRRMDAAPTSTDAVREWIRGMAAQAQSAAGAQASRPFALARGRLAESFPEGVARSQALVTAPLESALERARAAGTMRAVEPGRDAEMLYHLMMGWVEARLVEAERPDRAEVARLESFVMAGLERDSATDGATDTRPPTATAPQNEPAPDAATEGEIPS